MEKKRPVLKIVKQDKCSKYNLNSKYLSSEYYRIQLITHTCIYIYCTQYTHVQHSVAISYCAPCWLAFVLLFLNIWKRSIFLNKLKLTPNGRFWKYEVKIVSIYLVKTIVDTIRLTSSITRTFVWFFLGCSPLVHSYHQNLDHLV